MRIRDVVVMGCVVWLAACGNQEAPPATTPTATPSAAPSAAPVASASAAPEASASAAPSASAPPVTVTPPPAVPQITQPLKDLVANAKTIKLTWREDLSSNEAKTVTIKAPTTIKSLLDAIGPDQMPSASTQAYMTTYMFRFEDAQGNPLATVSLYSSPNLSETAKLNARVDVSATGKFGGLTVAKYEELQKRLKALGVPLP